MTDAERQHIELVADRAAKAAVRDVLINLGVDPSDSASIAAWHADRQFVGRARRGSEHGFKAVFAAISTAVALAVWLGVQAVLGRG